MNLPSWTNDYIGIPFKEHGRGRDGCDCWGLCRLIWKYQFGLDLPSFGETYKTAFDGSQVGETLVENGIENPEWMQIIPGAEVPGDAVLMSGFYRVNGTWKKASMHVGLVVFPGWLIHIEQGIDSVIADYRRDRRIKNRVIGFYRHRSLS